MSKWTDWIPLTGDECPVADRERVKVKTRSGRVVKDMAAEFPWVYDGLTHYKRLRKNVEAERAAELKWTDEQLKEMEVSSEDSTPLQPNRLPPLKIGDASEATPKPIITGPGEYVTRDGKRAVVCELVPNTPWPATGYVESLGYGVTWNQWGECLDWPHDITGPWQEPEKPETKPEVWRNLYWCKMGYLYLAPDRYKSLGSAAEHALRSNYTHIGTVLLNPEEE